MARANGASRRRVAADSEHSPERPTTASASQQQRPEPENDFAPGTQEKTIVDANANRIVQYWLHQHSSNKDLRVEETDLFMQGQMPLFKRDSYQKALALLRDVCGFKLKAKDESKSSTYANVPKVARLYYVTVPSHARFEPKCDPPVLENNVMTVPGEVRELVLQCERAYLINILCLILLSFPNEYVAADGLALEFAKGRRAVCSANNKATERDPQQRKLILVGPFKAFIDKYVKLQFLIRESKLDNDFNVTFRSVDSGTNDPKKVKHYIKWGKRAEEIFDKKRLLDVALNTINGYPMDRLANSALQEAQKEVKEGRFNRNKKYIFDFEFAYAEYYKGEERKQWDAVKTYIETKRSLCRNAVKTRSERPGTVKKTAVVRTATQQKPKPKPKPGKSGAENTTSSKLKKKSNTAKLNVTINEDANTTRIRSQHEETDDDEPVAIQSHAVASDHNVAGRKKRPKTPPAFAALAESGSSSDEDDAGDSNFIKARATTLSGKRVVQTDADLPGVTPRPPAKRRRTAEPVKAVGKKILASVVPPIIPPSTSDVSKPKIVRQKKATARKTINSFHHPLEAPRVVAKIKVTRSQPLSRDVPPKSTSKSVTQVADKNAVDSSHDDNTNTNSSTDATFDALNDPENSMDTPVVADENETRVLYTIDGPDGDRVQIQQRHLDSLSGTEHIDDVVLQAYSYLLYQTYPKLWEQWPIISPVQVKVALTTPEVAADTLKPFSGEEGKRKGILFILAHGHHFIAVKVMLGTRPKRQSQLSSAPTISSQLPGPPTITILDSMRGGFWHRAKEVVRFIELLTPVVPEMGDVQRARFQLGTYQMQTPSNNNCGCFAMHAVRRWLEDKLPLRIFASELLNESEMRKTLHVSLETKSPVVFPTFNYKPMVPVGESVKCSLKYLQGDVEKPPLPDVETGRQLQEYDAFKEEIETKIACED